MSTQCYQRLQRDEENMIAEIEVGRNPDLDLNERNVLFIWLYRFTPKLQNNDLNQGSEWVGGRWQRKVYEICPLYLETVTVTHLFCTRAYLILSPLYF